MTISQSVKSALDVAATIAVIVAAALFISGYLRSSPAGGPAANVMDVGGERIEASLITKRHGTGSVALVEFADYECPFCARHVREAHPRIKREFIDTGLIQHVFMSFPIEEIHPRAFGASEAAECAGTQGRFWQMHELLFENIHALARADLHRYAADLELDEQAFEKCLAGEAALIVLSDMQEGRRLGVRGTPAFFLGRVETDGSIELTRRVNGAVPFETFREEINAALGRRTGWLAWLR